MLQPPVAAATAAFLSLACYPIAQAWAPMLPIERKTLTALHVHASPRRQILLTGLTTAVSAAVGSPAAVADVSVADGAATTALPEVEVVPSGDARKLFNEGRALEGQGNMAAAQRIYFKVTKMSPRFIYGWSNLGNTQVAMGQLKEAEENYSTAIRLCNESNEALDNKFGVRRCSDQYLLLLNRGTVRLNSGMVKDALADLQQASLLRERPDAIILQNLARAKELNGLYSQADRDYTLAISMTANEVNPFWLRSANVKLQLGDVQGGFDLLKRVENRFPEAPEVRAAYATFLAAKGDQTAAQQKFLEIPDRQRAKYADNEYLTKVISWPPVMIDTLAKVTAAVGDRRS